MAIFYDVIYVISTVVSLVLHAYLIKIAHLFIIRRKIDDEWLEDII